MSAALFTSRILTRCRPPGSGVFVLRASGAIDAVCLADVALGRDASVIRALTVGMSGLLLFKRILAPIALPKALRRFRQ